MVNHKNESAPVRMTFLIINFYIVTSRCHAERSRSIGLKFNILKYDKLPR